MGTKPDEISAAEELQAIRPFESSISNANDPIVVPYKTLEMELAALQQQKTWAANDLKQREETKVVLPTLSERLKIKLRIASKNMKPSYIFVGIAVVAMVMSLVMFRYDLQPASQGRWVYKLDRWTGTVSGIVNGGQTDDVSK